MAECNECKKIIKTPTGATSRLFTHIKQHSEFVEKLKNHEELKKNTSPGPLKKFVNMNGSGQFISNFIFIL